MENGNQTLNCPAWENMGQEQLPFFSPSEENKRQGLTGIKFLADGPRKQTENTFDRNNPKPELWFDIEVQGVQMTWTISQVSLLIALKKMAPLKGKIFDIKLEPVTAEFRKENPNYKGKERYVVTEAARESLGSAPVPNPPTATPTNQLVEELVK